MKIDPVPIKFLKVHCINVNAISSEKFYKPLTMNERIEPHEHDILMGRGGKNNQHVGNENLRDMAREQAAVYRESSKKGKSYISRQLVRAARNLIPPARFLRKNIGAGLWEDVGDEIAREKASQALRDAVSSKYDTPSSAVAPVLPEHQPSTHDPSFRRRRRSSDPCAAEYLTASRNRRVRAWREAESGARSIPAYSPEKQSEGRYMSGYSTEGQSRARPTPVYSTPHYLAVSPAPAERGGERRHHFPSESAARDHSRVYDYPPGGPSCVSGQGRSLLPVTASPIQVARSYPQHQYHAGHQFPTQQANPRAGVAFDDSPRETLSVDQEELTDFDLFDGELLNDGRRTYSSPRRNHTY